MANRIENEKFTQAIMVSFPLDEGIEWIQKNLIPEDVFTTIQLEGWAEAHDYIKI